MKCFRYKSCCGHGVFPAVKTLTKTVVKSLCCFSRGPEFSSQWPITLAPRESDPLGTCTHMYTFPSCIHSYTIQIKIKGGGGWKGKRKEEGEWENVYLNRTILKIKKYINKNKSFKTTTKLEFLPGAEVPEQSSTEAELLVSWSLRSA